MDEINTSDKIFTSYEVNHKTQKYYDKINIINKYYERIDGIIRKFFSTLRDFINSYINTLVYSDNYQYTTTSSTNKALVETVIKELNDINNNIKEYIKNIKKENNGIESTVNTQSNEHSKLLQKYKNASAINNGSDILFNQSIDLYKMQYLINFFIIIGVFILIISLYQIYKKN